MIVLFSSLWSYNDYLTPYVMLGGEYTEIPAASSLLSVEILKQSFNNFSFSYGAAMSILMTLLALLFAFVYLRLAQPQALEQGRSPKRSPWTWALAGLTGLFGAFFVGRAAFAPGGGAGARRRRGAPYPALFGPRGARGAAGPHAARRVVLTVLSCCFRSTGL